MSDADPIVTDARRAERRGAMAPSTLRADGAAPLDVIVVDISATGIRIVTAAALEVGQEISIGLAGAGTTRAYVTWARGDEYGCAFAKPLAPDDEARAFGNATPIVLGRAAVPTPPAPAAAALDNLQDLYVQHRVWALPPDAILASLLILAGIAGTAWMMFGR